MSCTCTSAITLINVLKLNVNTFVAVEVVPRAQRDGVRPSVEARFEFAAEVVFAQHVSQPRRFFNLRFTTHVQQRELIRKAIGFRRELHP